MRNRHVAFGVLTLSAIAIFTGCSGESRVKQLEEQNKAVVRHVHEEMAKGNLAVFGEVLSPDYVRHCQAMPPGLQELHGTEQFIAFMKEFLEAVPDCRDTIDLMIAEGDKVAYVTTMTGTQTGPMGGLPASGKSFSVVNIIVHRFEDGKIAETWVSWDNLDMLSQLGLFPPTVSETTQESERDAKMTYTRVYADENGESHFEDIAVGFKTVNFAPPAPPVEISEYTPANQYAILRVPAGLFGDWHPAPGRQTHFYLSGEIEAEVSDGEVRRFGPGSVVLVEDTTGKGHTSRAVGTAEVVIAVVRLD